MPAPRPPDPGGAGSGGSPTTVAYGIGYSERDLLRGSAGPRRNLFGMDRSLGLRRISFRGSRLLASYREPYLFGRNRARHGLSRGRGPRSFDFASATAACSEPATLSRGPFA
jgi:hypothetical protein